jgi:photosystem II stability/assembly factor-like uncharacterized protein
VQVSAEEPFHRAFLRFRLAPDDVAHLVPGSLLVARWDVGAGRFGIIPQSGYSETGGYAFARITRPGIYTAVGLPADPRLLTTLRLVRVLRPWLRVGPVGQRLQERASQVLLGDDSLPEVGGDRPWLAELGLGPADFPSRFSGGDLREHFAGVNAAALPELQILDLVGLPAAAARADVALPPLAPEPYARWKSLGPVNVTGRTGVLAIHPTDGRTVYAGTTGGGVWGTTDGGASWSPLMARELSLAIGGLGVAPSDPRVLYAATGEWTGGIGWPVDPVTRGVGVYRTGDGGLHWRRCGPISSTTCAEVAVDPGNPNRVFVAGENGLHRSTDGGASWPVAPGKLHGVFDGEVSEVVIDPHDASRLYMGVHRDGIYRSTNGGDSWTRLEAGIDTGSVADAPKIALGSRGQHGSRFVAVKMGDRVYTSPDGGDHFARQGDVGNPIWFTAWANVIAVDPQNEDVLFAGASNLYRSTNGGAPGSWSQVGGYGTNVHADMQGIVFDPADRNRMYLATDGGVWRSTDNGQHWTFVSRGLAGAHLYVMGVSQTPTLRYGAAVQDDDGYAFTGSPDWVALGRGEGGYVEYDPSNEKVIYHDTWYSNLLRSPDGGSSWADLGIDTSAGRVNDYAVPLAIAWRNPNLLLALKVGSNAVARTTTGGPPWTDVLAPGAPLSAVRFAPTDDGHAYVGSSTGDVWHSDDGGARWTKLDTTGLPRAKVQSQAVSWVDPRRIYLAFAGAGVRHLFRGDLGAGGGVRWFDVSGALPAVSLPDLPLTGLALHPTQEGVLYVSTLLGVLRTLDGGDSWAPFEDGLPRAFVSDLDMRAVDQSLFASTMGRGIYCVSV